MPYQSARAKDERALQSRGEIPFAASKIGDVRFRASRQDVRHRGSPRSPSES